ncbi:protoporphyrinogen oxidase [Virgibacillus pantothenticus]|uniref:protoporphyrinogen oxidase n=1 Tax=Virgibacillus pantothenticus TaxID=1473 RepID=UPI00098601C7|nr:protoporphyrinogen oxidase [Virgibacillus pantothenticus]
MNNPKQFVVIGGGITGLSATYYLQKEIAEKQLPYKVKLVEASNRLGGKIRTLQRDGFTIEQGADSMLIRKKPALKLVNELGLEDQIVRNATGKSYILKGNKFHRMPQDTFMGIPKSARSVLSSTLISPKGKMRALADLWKGKRNEETDESLAAFFRRRFGNELLHNQIETLLSGIHSGNIEEMSLKASYPQFLQLEKEYGSLIKGLKQTIPQAKQERTKEPAPGAFFSFRNGLCTLVDRLRETIGEENITLETAVDHIEKKEHGYHLLLSDGGVYKADAVIMATPHFTVPKMFSQYDIFKPFLDVPATSTANIVLAFDKVKIKKDIDGTGFLVGKNSNYHITACTWTHKKWPLTTPDGKVLLRCYVGRPGEEAIVEESDDALTNLVLKDLHKAMKLKGDPMFSVVTRWRNGRPQYTVGHLERLAEIRKQAATQIPGVFLTGCSYDGQGIPDCIEQGERTAQEALHFVLR